MKKFLSFSILAAAALTMTPAVNAQEADYNYTNIPPAKDIYTHSWRDNWYIQLGAGAQMPIFEKNGDASNFQMKKTTALYEAGVGHCSRHTSDSVSADKVAQCIGKTATNGTKGNMPTSTWKSLGICSTAFAA